MESCLDYLKVTTENTEAEQLYAWGSNSYGWIGNDRTDRSSPTQVPGNWTLDNIDGGRNHDVFGAIKLGLTPSQL